MKKIFLIFAIIILSGCVREKIVYVPTCPNGPAWMTKADYEIVSDPSKISDQLADWILETSMFCESPKSTSPNKV